MDFPTDLKNRGLLITLEGLEGSGKSTLIRTLVPLLEKEGRLVYATREPGGTALGEEIRALLLHRKMDPWTELLLYQAARAEHTSQVILPRYRHGWIVLCDRFVDSTLAYQAHARGLPWEQVALLNDWASFHVQPDLTVFLDIEPQRGLKRVQDPNRFEAEGLAFHEQVREGFLRAKGASKARHWLTLKVQDQTPDELAQQVLKCLKVQISCDGRTPLS